MSGDKRQIVAGKAHRGSAEEKQFNIDFWRKISPGEKMAAAWDMVAEIAWFKGQPHGSESRLQRSVERLERRRR